MESTAWPEIVREMPEADIPFEGVSGRLMQGPDQQLVFFDIEPIGEVAPHSHGAQWGIVVDGEMDLTIGGETKTLRKGDSYFILAGIVHSAKFRTKVRVIDLFADADRYHPKA